MKLYFLFLFLHVIRCKLVDRLSFEKPFDQISAEGVREISGQWDFGGHTVVNRHFIRLTTDRQSKRGYIWSKNVLNMNEFSLIFTFRISGQAERWFGDGIALWITTEKKHQDGDNHGFLGTYTGFGILFDTFVNTDHSGGHRDVALLINNGKKTLDDLNYENKIGCDAKTMRYHEKNAAFSPSLNMSRAKLHYKNNELEIFMDPNNLGEWQNCYKTTLQLPKDWIIDATIGVSASTGALADNHDVIGISVYDEVNDSLHAAHDTKVKENAIEAPVNISDTNDAKVAALKKQYEKLLEEFEHQFEALKEETQNTIAKLRKQEEEDAKRILELEDWVNGKVSAKLDDSVKDIHTKVQDKIKKTVADGVSKSGSWRLPFFILVVAICGAGFVAYKKYQELRKSHLL